MTERESYEYTLMELRKAKAPSLHLEDYIYWMNKGIQEYINERYKLFQQTQQLTDDLQALIVPTVFTITKTGLVYTGMYSGDYTSATPLSVSTGKRYDSDYYRFSTPNNYWHMLGAHVTVRLRTSYKCYVKGYTTSMPAKKLTQDVANGIINNAFLKPLFNRPYFSFSNGAQIKPDVLFFVGDLNKFTATEIAIDYLKEPRKIALTKTQIDLPLDTSATLEFPDYVCNEIIKRVVKLVLEATSDPRLKTNVAVNQSIPS